MVEELNSNLEENLRTKIHDKNFIDKRVKNYCCGDESLLFFFLLLAIFFQNGIICTDKDSLLFFFLLLTIILGG